MTIRRQIGRFAEIVQELPQLISCYRALDSNLERNDLVPFCFAHPICPIQVPVEFGELCEEINQLRPRAALEIGTYSGGTLFVLCRLAAPDATIVSIDLPGGKFGGGYTWMQQVVFRKFTREQQRLCCIRADSHSSKTVTKTLAALRGRDLDYLFIDGDHTYEGVKLDFELYSPLVRKGGIIVFHDIAKHPEDRNCHVDLLWNEVKAAFRHREIMAQPNQDWAGIGILYV